MTDELFLLVVHDEAPSLEIYVGLDSLLGEIEPPGVLEGAYSVFDSAGRRAVLDASRRRWDVTVDRWIEGQAQAMRHAVLAAVDEADKERLQDLTPPEILRLLLERLGPGPKVKPWPLIEFFKKVLRMNCW